MGKVLQFRPPRPQLKAVPRTQGTACLKCHHKMNVHITHPNGVTSCSARGCPCETRPAR
jgi:hypothetical protein